MKSLPRCVFVIALASLFFASVSQADEKPAPPTNTDLYEIRVYMGYPVFDTTTQKPQIKTQIQVDKYFFAKNVLPTEIGPKSGKTIYVASGVLHPAKDGKFPLDRTFMWWGDGASSLTSGPNTIELELDKPVEFAMSMGLVMGWTAVLSKVPPAQSAPKAG
ncbi:hypothetical protein EON83_18210 [bacterium]|nr:MAG: hypothetical protein EON83_18210 [bacterium]